MSEYQKVEISFPCAVEIPDDFFRRLDALVGEVCEAYEAKNPDRVMWPAGHGSKINWSQMDAAFLGRPAEPGAKGSGEPDYNDAIYEISVSEREAYEGERADREKRRNDRTRHEHAATAKRNEGQPGMPQGPCQCPICKP